MSRQEVHHIAKLLLIGDSSVGKSCLLLRYFDGSFTTNFITTIGIDFKIKMVSLKNKNGEQRNVKLQIWDTAGQERFKTITTAYYRGADGIFLVYDVSNKSSFESTSNWMQQITKNASDKCKRILVANKCDRTDWQVTSEDGKKAALENDDVPFFEVSAKEGTNVDEMFHKMAELVLVHLEEDAERKGKEAKKRGKRLPLGRESGGGKKNGCC
eukprot:g5100.t1